MNQTELQLHNILSLAYEQKILGRGNLDNILAIFSRQCGLDSNFLKEAEKRLASYGSELKRCIVSKTHRDFLEKAIKQVKEMKVE